MHRSDRCKAAVAIVALATACGSGDGDLERAGTSAAALNGPTVWVVGSMVRVGQQDSPGSSTTAQIAAGRGEYESFQIVVAGPTGGLSNVNVSVSDLSGPGGATIAHTNVALFREYYVAVTASSPNWGGSNQPLGAGVYPDGLVPFLDPSTGMAPSGGTIPAAPFNVSAGQNQPVWVDVLVPTNAPRGAYTGTYTVTSDQGMTTGPIALTVWGFTLPPKPAMKSSFLFWNGPSQAVLEEILRNKLDPLSEPSAEQSALMSGFGLQSVGLPFFSGADVGNCTMSAPPSVAAVQAAAASQQAGLYLYAYTADEIGSCTGLYPTVQAWAQVMHAAGVDNLITMAPVPQLFDDGSGKGRSAVDDWTMLPVTFDGAKPAIAMALAKGDRLWSYNTLVQDAYSPKWEIDFPPLNFRLQPGFLSATLSLTGILYWKTDNWSPDPWVDVNNQGTYSSGNYPGEAQLLYPGQDVGVVGAAPSMRLKFLRDGVEDYDYYALLVKAGKGSWALQQIAPIAPDWSGWTRDPSAVASTRQVLGMALDGLTGGGDAGGGGAEGGVDSGAAGSEGGPGGGASSSGDGGGQGAADQPSTSPASSGCTCVAGGSFHGGAGGAGLMMVFAAALLRRRRARR